MSVAHPLRRSWAYLDQHSGLMASFVFVLSLIVYIATLAPGLLWGGGDFAAFQTRALTGEGIRGGVFGHSLWIILSRPFIWLPIRDVAYRANLASAVYAAAALAFVFLSARRLTRAAAPALLGTAALLVSHTFWTYAVMSKVYSLNALLLALCVYGLLRWSDQRRGLYLYLFAVIYALSLMNHLVMATAALGFGVYIALIARRNFNRAMLIQVFVGAALFVLSLIPYLLISESSGDTGDTVLIIGSFLGGLAQLITQPASLLLGLVIGAALLFINFRYFVAGLIGLARHRPAGSSGGLAAPLDCGGRHRLHAGRDRSAHRRRICVESALLFAAVCDLQPVDRNRVEGLVAAGDAITPAPDVDGAGGRCRADRVVSSCANRRAAISQQHPGLPRTTRSRQHYLRAVTVETE
jgi:hypothetical protein